MFKAIFTILCKINRLFIVVLCLDLLILFFFLSGVISLSRSLHSKANTVISMVITAVDGDGLTAPVNARVNVSIVGGSTSSPVFEQAQYFFTVSEDVLRGTAVGVVRAATKTGGNVYFLSLILLLLYISKLLLELSVKLLLCDVPVTSLRIEMCH